MVHFHLGRLSAVGRRFLSRQWPAERSGANRPPPLPAGMPADSPRLGTGPAAAPRPTDSPPRINGHNDLSQRQAAATAKRASVEGLRGVGHAGGRAGGRWGGGRRLALCPGR